MQSSTKVTEALWQLRGLDSASGCPAFALETALGALLAVKADPILTRKNYELLFAATLRAHASAIERLGDKISSHNINLGMGAAYAMFEGLRMGLTDTDQMSDARARVKILIHHSRIAQHEDAIERRRLSRHRTEINKLLAEDDVEDIFS